MNRKVLIVPLVVVLVGNPAWGYQMNSWAFSGGAHTGSSTSYRLTATLGQASPIGISTGGAVHDLYHGFWYTQFGTPLTIPSLHITRLTATEARLWWHTISSAASYDIYRGPAAFFAPGSRWQTVMAPDTSYTFSEGIGNANSNYCFLCRSVGPWGESDDSNRVGEFDFETGMLVRGHAGSGTDEKK